MTAVAFWAVVAVLAFLWTLGRLQGGRRRWNGRWLPVIGIAAAAAVWALLGRP